MLPKLIISLSLLLFVGNSYKLIDDYPAKQFGDKFDFFTKADPTNGFVKYVDRKTAEQQGLFKANDKGQVYIGVDYKNVAKDGRQSIRIESKANYTRGLFILDLAHMPASICGTWPAFWLLGSGVEWPQNGEIDIIEGVNLQQGNSIALHTTDNCKINKTKEYTGEVRASNCYIKAPGQDDNQGCQIFNSNLNAYGDGFNKVGGGVYAVEWTSKEITVWNFASSSIPENIKSGKPDPSKWPMPAARFSGCDIDQHFKNHKIIFDLTFCGQWAGREWKNGECIKKSSDCTAFVRDNPTAFTDSYWLVNSLKVYQQDTTSFAFNRKCGFLLESLMLLQFCFLVLNKFI